MRSNTVWLYVLPWLALSHPITPALAQSQLNGFDISRAEIDAKEIRRGGPPRDGIAALNDPPFIPGRAAAYMEDMDRVLGVAYGGVAKAYPIKILDQHEIVNDRIAGTAIAVTYCPLCGSGMTFEANVDGRLVFGVSGLLYNSDVLLFDRNTESLWSQILGKAISGPLAGADLVLLPTENTTWGAWKRAYPDTTILSPRTGYVRDYSRQVYGNYHASPSLMFPVENRDRRYHAKAPVIGVTIGGSSKAYPLIELAYSNATIEDVLGGEEIEIHYDAISQSAQVLDQEGIEIPSTRLYWFAWYAFHPNTDVYLSPETPEKKRKRWRVENDE